MTGRQQGLMEAVAYVEFFADERMTLCGDSILHDPVLDGGRSPEDFARSAELQIEGTINSAAYHAATQIAEHLRKMASGEAPSLLITPREADAMKAQAYSVGFRAGFRQAVEARLWQAIKAFGRGRLW